MDNTKYLSICKKCKKKTTHLPFNFSRKAGVRLVCFDCGTKKLRYSNLKDLKEIVENENDNIEKMEVENEKNK